MKAYKGNGKTAEEIPADLLTAAKEGHSALVEAAAEGDDTLLEKYVEPGQIKDWIIEQPFYTRLNKLKKSNPEAFFYWFKTYKLTIK